MKTILLTEHEIYLSVFVITDLIIIFLMEFCMGSGGPNDYSIEIARSRSKFPLYLKRFDIASIYLSHVIDTF